MPTLFQRYTKNVKDINQEYSSRHLIIDRSYQRRIVWLPQDKVRLIETILLDLVMPEVFFWPAELNPENGETITHIVDGQQRITAIIEFLANEFRLDEKYLLNDSIKSRCGNKYFFDLTQEDKSKIWLYNLSIVEIDITFKKEDIQQMFFRLNLTNYSLNEQEKLKGRNSAFGAAAEALSLLDFWNNCRVFSAKDARRMLDIRYCCSIYILAKDGIVDQTSSTIIEDHYSDFSDKFDEDKSLYRRIETAIDFIDAIRDKVTLSFISKKVQMYTLFCVAFKMQDNKIEPNTSMFSRFKLFVQAYNKFRNEFTMQFESENVRILHEDIKKYKLAASEGVNKIGNRVIRLQVLYRILVEQNEIEEDLKQLLLLYESEIAKRNIEKEVFDEEDNLDINDISSLTD